jgi:hypothetical protein
MGLFLQRALLMTKYVMYRALSLRSSLRSVSCSPVDLTFLLLIVQGHVLLIWCESVACNRGYQSQMLDTGAKIWFQIMLIAFPFVRLRPLFKCCHNGQKWLACGGITEPQWY